MACHSVSRGRSSAVTPYRQPYEHGKKSMKWLKQRAESVKANNVSFRAGTSFGDILDSMAQLRQSELSPINVATILSKLVKFQAAARVGNGIGLCL